MKKIIFVLLIAVTVFGCEVIQTESKIGADNAVIAEASETVVDRGNTPCEICRAAQVPKVVYDVYNKPHTIMVWTVICTKTYNCP